MSDEARAFNTVETGAFVKFFFFFLQGKAPMEIHAILMTVTLRKNAQSYATVKHWVTHLKRGDFPHVMLLVLDDPKQ